jgi:tripartite-type tricarboxylate transporter receptor subunit TctC
MFMGNPLRRAVLQAGAAGALAGALPQVRAAAPAADAASSYPDPSRPIRMVVAFVPGGGTDLVGRIAARALSEELNASVVVENRAGAGGIVGTQFVARSAPDGYTLITAGTGTHAINPWLYSHIPYDAIKDFDSVNLVASSPYLMLVSNDFPARTVKEFIEIASSKPGKIDMASSGNGGMPHLAGELFQLMTHTKLNHVPYKGTGAVFTDLIAGRTQVTFADIAAAYPHVKAGSVRALGITSPQRSPSYPDIPTIAATVPGYEAVGWFGVFSPAGTPAPINRKISDAIARFVQRPDVQEQFKTLGADPVALGPAAFHKIWVADLKRWGEVVKASGAHVD